jgi:hypothetical protein
LFEKKRDGGGQQFTVRGDGLRAGFIYGKPARQVEKEKKMRREGSEKV